MVRILALSLIVLSFLTAPAAAQSPTFEVTPLRGAEAREAGGWVIEPHLETGLNRRPAPAIRARASEPVEHTPENVVALSLVAPEETVVTVTGLRTDGTNEVFPSRAVPGSGEPVELLWSIDTRVGVSSTLDGFEFAFAAPKHAEQTAPVVLQEVALRSAKDLSDDQVLAATSYEPLTLRFTRPVSYRPEQMAIIVLPREIGARAIGGRVFLRIGEQTPVEFEVTDPSNNSRNVLFFETPLEVFGLPATEQEVSLFVEELGEEPLLVSTQRFSVLDPEAPFGQFEAPYQSIEAYELMPLQPDLRIVAVQRDLYTKAQPAGFAANTREVLEHTMSLSTGRFESQPSWRVPAFNHWGEAGFASIGQGKFRQVTSFYVSGANALGEEWLGVATAVGRGAVRPAIVNPLYFPAAAFTGWEEGMARPVRGIAIEKYGRTSLMLHTGSAGNGPAQFLAAATPDLQNFGDVGPVDLDLPPHTSHLDLYQRDGWYYLLTGAADEIYVSRRPVQEWNPVPVEFPASREAFRLFDLQGETHLFGLEEIDGKKLLRWEPVSWQGSDPPIPVVGAGTEPAE